MPAKQLQQEELLRSGLDMLVLETPWGSRQGLSILAMVSVTLTVVCGAGVAVVGSLTHYVFHVLTSVEVCGLAMAL